MVISIRPGILQAFVKRNDFTDQAQVLAEQDGFIAFVKIRPFGDQSIQRGFCQPIGVYPTQVEQDLQVAEILLGECIDGIALATFVRQFLVAREAGHNLGVDVEEAVQDELLLLLIQLPRGPPPSSQYRSLAPAARSSSWRIRLG
jgi:hypothetical protein